MDDRMDSKAGGSASKLAFLFADKSAMPHQKAWPREAVDALLGEMSRAAALGDGAWVESLLDKWGGLPSQGHESGRCGEFVHMLASYPKAPGLKKAVEGLWAARQADLLAGWRQRVADGSSGARNPAADWAGELGEWLRSGMSNEFWGGSSIGNFSFSDWTRPGRAPRPLASCLANDNPEALAEILAMDGAMEALAAMEPKPSGQPFMKEPSSLDSDKEASRALAERAMVEKSLIWHAVGAKAHRCAALLACMPEFNGPLVDEWAYGSLSFRSLMELRDGPFERAEGSRAGFFEHWIGRMSTLSDSTSDFHDRFENILLPAMELIEFPKGAPGRSLSGLGWPELAFGALGISRWSESFEGSNPHGQRACALFLKAAVLMEEKGFKPQWKELGAACRGKTLREYLELQAEASKPAPEPSERKPRL